MIKVTGNLTVRTINGRNGEFSVGRLITELGEFSVKDTLLDQYEEGSYEGEFGIGRIFPSHYLAGSRLVVEIRAVIEAVALAGIDYGVEPETPEVEHDPIHDKTETPVPVPVETEAKEAAELVTRDDDIAELFGILWPIGEKVVLDPTVDRALFRRQRDYLKDNGYSFQPIGQSWEKTISHES
ncbi:MAG: DUF3275 family protein [Gammaproteobacteria bacterium]